MAGDRKTMQLQLTLPIVGSIEERLVDGVLYVNLGSAGALSGKLPDGKQWVSIDLDALKSATGHDLGALFDQAQGAGPTQGLEYLQGLSGDVTKVGDDTVAGEPATHYRASIDYAKVADKLHDASPDLADKLGEARQRPGRRVDQRRRPRREDAVRDRWWRARRGTRGTSTSPWRSPISVCPSTCRRPPPTRRSTSPR